MPKTYEPIATQTLGSDTATVTFSTIPQTYTDLVVACHLSGSRATFGGDFLTRFNGDTGANYSRHYLFGDGASLGSGGVANETRILTDGCTGASATSGIFGVGIVDVIDYADVNKYKTLRGLTAYDRNGGGLIVVNSGSWRSTVAINTITVTSYYASNFVQYSSFALYGIKG
jgi:hypothetical protein